MSNPLAPALDRVETLLFTRFGVSPRTLDRDEFFAYYESETAGRAPPLLTEDPIGVTVIAQVYSHPSCPRSTPLTWSVKGPLQLSALATLAREVPEVLRTVGWLPDMDASPEDAWGALVSSHSAWFRSAQHEGGEYPGGSRTVALGDLYWRQVLSSGISFPGDLNGEVRKAVRLAGLTAPNSEVDFSDEVQVVMGDHFRAHAEGQERAWYFLGDDRCIHLNARGFRDSLEAAREAPPQLPEGIKVVALDWATDDEESPPSAAIMWHGPDPADIAEPGPDHVQLLGWLGVLERLDDFPGFTKGERAVAVGTLRLAQDWRLPETLGGRDHHRLLADIGVKVSHEGLRKLWPRLVEKLSRAS